MRLVALLAICLVASADVTVKREGLGGARKRLRYRGRIGETQPLRLVMWQELKRSADDGRAAQKQESPRVTLGLEITPERFEGGVTFFRVRVASAETTGGTVSADQVSSVRRAVGALKGLVGRGAVAEDGSGADLVWDGLERLPPASEPVAEEARAMLAGAFVPLPAAPMGEDGCWVVPSHGDAAPGEPPITETVFTCSVIGDGATITATGAAEATMAVEVAGGAAVRDRVAVETRYRARVRPGLLFPAQAATRTVTAHYSSGVSDRQSWELRLLGPEEPEPRAITVTADGEEPRAPIEYPASVRARRYAIEYLAHETESRDDRVLKSGLPRVRVVVRCQEWPQSEPRFSDGCVMQWTVEEAELVGDAPDAQSRNRTLKALVGLAGGGAYGRACDPIVGYVRDDALEGRLRTKRARMEPELWFELPDGASTEVEREAARLCEVVEGSMLPLPEKRFDVPDDSHGDVAVRVARIGKGGTWRHVDEIRLPGLKPLKRVVECTVADVADEAFTVSCRSRDKHADLGPMELDGARAELVSCTALRTGSWTIARDHPMPARANVEEVLDREFLVADPDGSTRTVRFHAVRSVTIEALETD